MYVAMTRAKEKLCLVMSLRQPASLLSRLAASLGDDDKLSAFTVLSARSMSEWLLACALRHPSGKILRDMAGDDAVSIRPAAYPWSVEVCRAPAAGENAVEEIAAVQPDMAVYETLRRQMCLRDRINTLHDRIVMSCSGTEVFRCDTALAKCGELMSLEGVVVTGPNQVTGRTESVVAYYKYYR